MVITAASVAYLNNPVELTAHSAGFWGYSWRFSLWAAAHRERSAAEVLELTICIIGRASLWASISLRAA
jgi:hypothetical protein